MAEYERTRNFAILEQPFKGELLNGEAIDWGGLSTLDEQPTAYLCEPLKVAYQKYIGQADPDSLWKTFAAHCIKARQVLDEHGNEITIEIKDDGTKRRRVASKHREQGDIPYNDFAQAAAVIMEGGASSATAPFTSVGIWDRLRGRRAFPPLAELVIVPTAKTAKKTPSN
jgi:hypothetical protein